MAHREGPAHFKPGNSSGKPRVVTTLADTDGNETLDPDALGACAAVREVRVGDGEMLYAHGEGVATARYVLFGAMSATPRGTRALCLDPAGRSRASSGWRRRARATACRRAHWQC